MGPIVLGGYVISSLLTRLSNSDWRIPLLWCTTYGTRAYFTLCTFVVVRWLECHPTHERFLVRILAQVLPFKYNGTRLFPSWTLLPLVCVSGMKACWHNKNGNINSLESCGSYVGDKTDKMVSKNFPREVKKNKTRHTFQQRKVNR